MARKKTTNPSTALIPAERIERSILLIRGEKVLLDRDLADLYQVETRVLIQAVKRNIGRFPTDFMFQLSTKELERWRSQFVMSNPTAKMGLRRRPYALTEQGVGRWGPATFPGCQSVGGAFRSSSRLLLPGIEPSQTKRSGSVTNGANCSVLAKISLPRTRVRGRSIA